jgi:single-strand DNA-binding protein
MINKVTLLGRVGTKEFKLAKNGHNLCQLSIATNRKWIDAKANRREATTWHNVNCFDKLAEIATKYVNVGDLVYIEGEIQNKKIDENGEIRHQFSITCNEIKFIPTGKKDVAEKSVGHHEVPDVYVDDSTHF